MVIKIARTRRLAIPILLRQCDLTILDSNGKLKFSVVGPIPTKYNSIFVRRCQDYLVLWIVPRQSPVNTVPQFAFGDRVVGIGAELRIFTENNCDLLVSAGVVVSGTEIG
jgi:hypothetical protein